MNRGRKALFYPALVTALILSAGAARAQDAGRGLEKRVQKKSSVSIVRSGKRENLLRADVDFCLEISDKECLDSARTFSIDAGRIFCHTVIHGAETYLEIKHRWYHSDKIDQIVRLPVKSVQWRTWSMKTLFPGAEGNWRVEIYAGDLKIGEGEFSITANGSIATERN